jgi:hypothetical protein
LSLLKRDGLNRYEFEKTMTMSIGYVTAWRLTLPSSSCRLSIFHGLFLQHKPILAWQRGGWIEEGEAWTRGEEEVAPYVSTVMFCFFCYILSRSLWFLFSGWLQY